MAPLGKWTWALLEESLASGEAGRMEEVQSVGKGPRAQAVERANFVLIVFDDLKKTACMFVCKMKKQQHMLPLRCVGF